MKLKTAVGIHWKEYLPIILTALLTVSLFRWFYSFAFLFPLPLCIVYFVKGNKVFIRSLFTTLCVSIILVLILDAPFDIYSIVMYGVFLLPLLWLDTRIIPVLRIRYRIVLIGITASLLFLPVLYLSGIGNDFTKAIEILVNNMITQIPALAAVDGAQTAPLISFDTNAFITYMITFVINSYMLFFIILYAFSWRFAGMCVSFFKYKIRSYFSLDKFYNEKWLLLPLAVSIAGIIIGLITSNSPISIISWNIALVCVFFFTVQGVGISIYFVQKIQPISFFARMLRFFLIFMLIIMSMTYIQFALCILVGAAVLEYWVPLRKRDTTEVSVH